MGCHYTPTTALTLIKGGIGSLTSVWALRMWGSGKEGRRGGPRPTDVRGMREGSVPAHSIGSQAAESGGPGPLRKLL